MYVHTETGRYPYTPAMLRADHPDTSFKRVISPEIMAEFGAEPVVVADRPEITGVQVAEQDTAPALQDDVWTLGWTVRDMTPEELQAERENAQRKIVKWIEAFLRPLTAQYPQDEVMSFAHKGPAAQRYQLGEHSAVDLEILQREAASLGITVADLAAQIAPKSALYTAAVAETSALRRNVSAQIDAATPDQYEAILNAAKAQAKTLAEGLGLTL